MNMPYKASLALHTGEDMQCIVSNREKTLKALHPQMRHIVLANQTHGDRIHVVSEKETKGWYEHESAIASCDGLITMQKGVLLGVLTADCVPVLLYDPVRESVGAVHAGWRGTASHIVSKCVVKMQKEFGVEPKNIIACIAPSIGRCCYEVDEAVVKKFDDIPKSHEVIGDGKYMLDLPYINKYQLLESGLSPENIHLSGICTACDTQRFFSYRKEHGCSGRFLSMIGMLPDMK